MKKENEMNHKKLFLISMLAIFALLLTACGADPAEPNAPTGNNPADAGTANDNMEENAADEESPEDSMPEITPTVSVSNQDASGGTVTIDEVIAAQLGWMVIHAEADSGPGPVIGFTQVQEGTNSSVSVEIDLDAATETLFAMLHIDAATAGEYEFPGDDVPVRVNDSVVVKPFTVSLPETSMDESMEEVTVTIGDSFFNPGELTVKAGTTVTWVMDANFPHTVTADDGSFDSGTMNNGQSFSVIFDQTGEVPYYCSIHGGPGGSGMSGTITVTE
jgi:plastocyanin